MKYSIGQIEAACEEAMMPEQVIGILTKPKWTPQVGEAYAHCQENMQWEYRRCAHAVAHYHRRDRGGDTNTKRRPLTPDEVPALKAAIEALEGLSGWASSQTTQSLVSASANKALAKIKELTQT